MPNRFGLFVVFMAFLPSTVEAQEPTNAVTGTVVDSSQQGLLVGSSDLRAVTRQRRERQQVTQPAAFPLDRRSPPSFGGGRLLVQETRLL